MDINRDKLREFHGDKELQDTLTKLFKVVIDQEIVNRAYADKPHTAPVPIAFSLWTKMLNDVKELFTEDKPRQVEEANV